MKKSQTALSPLKKYSFKVVLAPIFKLVECICELFVPFLVKDIIDIGIANGDFQYVLIRSLIMMGFALLGFGVTMITQYLSARVAADYAYDLKRDIFHHMDSLSSRQLETFSKSKALTLLNNDSFSLQVGVNMFMRLFVRAPFLVIGTIVMSFIISPNLGGWIVLGSLLACSIVIIIVVASTPKKYQAIQEELDHLSTLGEDDLTGARVVRAFNKEKDSEQTFAKASSSYQKKATSLAKINSLINPLTFAFVNLAIFLILYLGGYRGGEGVLSAGTIASLINYLNQALIALILFTRLVTSLSKAMAGKKRVDSFFALEPEIVSGSSMFKDDYQGELFCLKHVSLSYGGKENALQDIDFSLSKGERIGIIGGTGSGKSSLINLLGRYVDVTGGEILCEGEPLKDYDLVSLRSQIALVSQKPQLYKGTIRSNVLLANPSASEEEIKKALDDSLASEFVSRFSEGLDHPVEEGGVNLSGGQKQRVLIARALLSERPILILDDSTSALDYQSDHKVRANIKKRKGLSTIIVSQRATSISDCDLIYVLDKGKIVASGKHDELLKSCSIYQEIYETQVAVQ